jgi:hypothetical protein
MCQVHSRPLGKTTRSPGPKLTEFVPSVTVTLPLSTRQVSFSVYSQLKVLGLHFQIGQALQVAASAAEGFLTMMSLTLGILFCSFGYFLWIQLVLFFFRLASLYLKRGIFEYAI